MFYGWISINDDMPVVGQDVLVYSVSMRGYAVGVTRYQRDGVKWFNSTNGLQFAPHSISHWRSLPPPPEQSLPEDVSSGYSGYGPV